jgi:hypothetical protein
VATTCALAALSAQADDPKETIADLDARLANFCRP